MASSTNPVTTRNMERARSGCGRKLPRLGVASPLILACLLVLCSSPASAQLPFSSSNIDIGLVVADLDSSVVFYEKTLGMTRVSTFSVDSTLARKTGLTSGEPFSAVVMKLENTDDAPALKLVSVGTPTRDKHRFIHHQAGVRYLTLQVAELGPILQRLRRHGVPVLGDAPVSLGSGSFFVLVQDPDGVFVELIGPMERIRKS